VRDPRNYASEEAAGFGIFEVAKSQRVENGNGTRTHRKNIAEDATDARRCTLKRFDSRGVIVRFDFESELKSIPQIDDTRIFTRPDKDAIACSRKLFEQRSGILVAAVLRPHHAKHT
jgi:hypothetical protein